MPAPPPPPPMTPAAPPPPTFNLSKSSSNDRGALLKSIRQGAKLKKTVTNDKSAPLISGKVSSGNTGNNNGVTSSEGFSSNTTAMATPNGLGGLFAGGMPKLKPTGKLGTPNSTVKSANNNSEVPAPVVTPTKNFNSIQIELKKQLASDSRNRGPPPPAPNRNISGETNNQRQPFALKENIPNGLHLSQLSLNASTLHSNSSTLHRKAKSNANLSTLDSTDDVNNGFQPTRPVISHGKPNLAPKPPALNGKPAPPQKKNGKPVSRAHSMKSPRSPSPQSPEGNPANKFSTVRHMSSILNQTLNATNHNPRQRPALNNRPSAPPPSIPSQQSPLNLFSSIQSQALPPPPSKVNAVKHPNHAPPPPPALMPQAPSHAPPPPPPHKTLPIRQLVIPVSNVNPPPPPPPRHSSMRDTPSTKKIGTDLDEKFKHYFQTSENFPQPPPYKNVLKIYAYTHKQGLYLKPGV